MSSSGSVSSSSSSESTESDRSKDRRLGGEGTSSGVVTSGMPIEVVREVREAAMGGLLLMFVINHLYSGGLVC